MKLDQEVTSSFETKQTWTKPELEMVSIKEQTLATFGGVAADNAIFS